MRWGLLLLVLTLPAWAGEGDGYECARIERALTSAPSSYVRTARVWVDGRERFFERVRVVEGEVKERVRNASGAEVRFDPDPVPPLPSCASLRQISENVWVAREPVPDIKGTRVLTYVFRENCLVRLRVEEEGSVGFLFFRKPIRFEVVYELAEGGP